MRLYEKGSTFATFDVMGILAVIVTVWAAIKRV